MVRIASARESYLTHPDWKNRPLDCGDLEMVLANWFGSRGRFFIFARVPEKGDGQPDLPAPLVDEVGEEGEDRHRRHEGEDWLPCYRVVPDRMSDTLAAANRGKNIV